MKFSKLIGLGLIALMLGACGGKDDGSATDAATDAAADDITVSDAELEGSPFMQEWDTPYGVPPFAVIENAHYMPATKKGIL
jgi:peptidyl-dipeptidase Dcp